MRLVKIGLASVNTTVGATHANVERALRFAEQMAAADVTVAVYPEQMVGGYPPEDLIQWHGFVEDQWRALEHFAGRRASRPRCTCSAWQWPTRGSATTARRWWRAGRSAAWCRRRSCPPTTSSTRGAPSPAAFPYQRDLHRGVPFGDLIFRFDFGIIALEVCEDIWTPDGPMRRRATRAPSWS